MRFILCRIPGVRHDHEAGRAEPRDDQVINDAGSFGEEEGVFRLPLVKRVRI